MDKKRFIEVMKVLIPEGEDIGFRTTGNTSLEVCWNWKKEGVKFEVTKLKAVSSTRLPKGF